jgi:hypothetical protein
MEWIVYNEYPITKDFLLKTKELSHLEKMQIMDAVEYGCSDWGSSKDAEKYYYTRYGVLFEKSEKEIHDWHEIERLKEQYKNQ